MAVETIRFNGEEEELLRKILAYYNKDFSTCVKTLLAEKLEDLQDIGVISKIKEGKKQDYLTAEDINKIYDEEA